jgi:tRNA pseudouridine38-40 synthase
VARFLLKLAYDGTDFSGWQIQTREGAEVESVRTVQAIVRRAVREAIREPVHIQGASRTDSGVHAAGQVAAFTRSDAPDRVGAPDGSLLAAINARLPEDITALECFPVRPCFQPISDASSKGYRYSLRDGGDRPLWDRRFVHHVRLRPGASLDVDAMREGAALLVGEHDFAAFAKAGHGRKTTVRTVHACEVARQDDGRITIDISGNGFLHNMVRIIAGTLVELGNGRMVVGRVAEALRGADRTLAGPTMPPRGLRLEWITYPPEVLDPTLAARERAEWDGGAGGAGSGVVDTEEAE